MRNSFPSQIHFVWVAFVIYTRLLLNYLHKNKIAASSTFHATLTNQSLKYVTEQLILGHTRQRNYEKSGIFRCQEIEFLSLSERALPYPQFALLPSVTWVQLRLIKVFGNCGCVVVASFLGEPSAIRSESVILLIANTPKITGDQLVARPLPVHNHKKKKNAHTYTNTKHP
jgi:hypothetical protein